MSIWQNGQVMTSTYSLLVVTVNEGRRDETGDHGDGGGILFSYFLVQNMCGTESLEICGEQSVSEDYCR